jgi:hypothetical protein
MMVNAELLCTVIAMTGTKSLSILGFISRAPRILFSELRLFFKTGVAANETGGRPASPYFSPLRSVSVGFFVPAVLRIYSTVLEDQSASFVNGAAVVSTA